MKRPVMLDLCSGLRGASAAMREAGWTVLSVDNNERLQPDIVADVRSLPLAPFPLDLLWASPPCLEYSRYEQPWFKDEPPPDLSIWQSVEKIIASWQPTFWIIENTRGARKFHGKDSIRMGSHYLWTNIPLLARPPVEYHHENVIPGRPRGIGRAQWRAKIPYDLSLAVRSSIEGALCV